MAMARLRASWQDRKQQADLKPLRQKGRRAELVRGKCGAVRMPGDPKRRGSDFGTPLSDVREPSAD